MEMIRGTTPFHATVRAMNETSTITVIWTAVSTSGVKIWNVEVNRCTKKRMTMQTMSTASSLDSFL